MKARKAAAPIRDEAARGPCETLGAELDRLLASMAPSGEVREHLRNAGLEVLKGMRSLIDDRIQSLSNGPRKGSSITIE